MPPITGPNMHLETANTRVLLAVGHHPGVGNCIFVAVLVQTSKMGLPVWRERLAYGLNEEMQALLRGSMVDSEESKETEKARREAREGMTVGLRIERSEGETEYYRLDRVNVPAADNTKGGIRRRDFDHNGRRQKVSV